MAAPTPEVYAKPVCQRCFARGYRRLHLPISRCEPGLQCEDCHEPADHLVEIPREQGTMLVDYAISQPSQNSIETVATVPSQFETDPETLERELGSTELDSILGLTVKRDSAAKKTTFLAMHLAQTSQDQYKVGFQAESGTGKTYIPDE